MTVLPPEDTTMVGRRSAGAMGEECEEIEAEESNLFDNEAQPEADEEHEVQDQPELPLEEGGHPLCTSQEDCQGTEEDPLIRHLLNGRPGDVYCRTCWTSFLEQNPHLEGEEEC